MRAQRQQISDDETFDQSDAEDFGTPTPCGSLKKGGYVVLRGYPCKVNPFS